MSQLVCPLARKFEGHVLVEAKISAPSLCSGTFSAKNFSYLLEICHASGAGGSAYTTLKRFLAVVGGTDNPFRVWLTQHHTTLKWKLPRENFHQLTAKRNDATERSRDAQLGNAR